MSEALNEIHAYFGKLNTTTTAPVKQWAYGQKLVIHDADLPNVFEAYYSNSRSKGEASPQIGTDGVVDAPHAYFRSGADIYVFLMVHEGQDDGRYNKIVHIPIDPCSQPSDVEPTPQEQSVIDQTIAALNEAVEQSESNVEHYPRIIDGYWNVWDAQTEQFVSTGVEAQGEKGDGGLAIFFSVPNKAIPTDANRKIVEDQSINFGVYAFKGGEIIDPENVTASAFTFQSGQYSGAINAVVTHSTSNRPQWHVSYTLRTSANITLRADSGTQTVNVTVDGVVHKIYFPWSAAKQGVQGEGGLSILIGQSGVLFPTNAEKTFTANYDTGAIPIRAVKGTEFIDIDSVDAISSIEFTRNGSLRILAPTIGFNPSDHTRYTVSHQFLAGDTFVNESGTISFDVEIDGVTYNRTIPWTLSKQGIQGEQGEVTTEEFLKAFPTDTASGAIASFSDGADDLPLKSLIVDINPIQDLSHGDPSPENICPISGWTQVNVNHSDADMTNPTTLTISLGQTVYGGKLDVLSGELVIDRAMVDLGTLNWTNEDSSLQGMARAAAGVAGLVAVYFQTPLCSTLKGTSPKSYSQVEMGTVCFSNSPSTPFIRVRSQIFSGLSDAEIKTALTGVQLCYELATPIEIQLTPNQINSLLGVNNLWADSGDTEVEYRADTRLYIEKLTQPEEHDMIADSAITSGQFFMVGNSLYRALANIASGATITVGTNAQRVSLSDALNLVNA